MGNQCLLNTLGCKSAKPLSAALAALCTFHTFSTINPT